MATPKDPRTQPKNLLPEYPEVNTPEMWDALYGYLDSCCDKDHDPDVFWIKSIQSSMASKGSSDAALNAEIAETDSADSTKNAAKNATDTGELQNDDGGVYETERATLHARCMSSDFEGAEQAFYKAKKSEENCKNLMDKMKILYEAAKMLYDEAAVHSKETALQAHTYITLQILKHLRGQYEQD